MWVRYSTIKTTGFTHTYTHKFHNLDKCYCHNHQPATALPEKSLSYSKRSFFFLVFLPRWNKREGSSTSYLSQTYASASLLPLYSFAAVQKVIMMASSLFVLCKYLIRAGWKYLSHSLIHFLSKKKKACIFQFSIKFTKMATYFLWLPLCSQ